MSLDERSFAAGVGVGIILWWLVTEFDKWRRKRKFDRALAALVQSGERIQADHQAGRRCEQRQCEWCDEHGLKR